MRENTTYVRNIKKYLLAALYNAPAAIGNYYTSLASHDHTADRETLSLCHKGEQSGSPSDQTARPKQETGEKRKQRFSLRPGWTKTFHPRYKTPPSIVHGSPKTGPPTGKERVFLDVPDGPRADYGTLRTSCLSF